jgi:YYY domain-containing protein
MIEAVIWILLVELIGLAALPLAYQVFRFLPERGYTLAKPLGLLGTAYLVWLVSMLGLPFNRLVCWLGFGLLFLVLNSWLLLRQGRQLLVELRSFLVQNRWLILLFEVIFLAAFAYLLNLRSYSPEIRDYEKFGDFAFLNSLSLYDQMPPADPWMSGYPINYYYFSHFMMAMLVKMTGIDPAIAFNLNIPLIFSMTALAALGIGFNLVRLAQGTWKSLRGPVIFGLMSLVMVCVLGNLDTVRQIFWPRPEQGETGIGNFAFSWWTPSRVIYDYMPQPGTNGMVYTWSQTINEFPMFSFLLADTHPHVMTLPTALLTISLALVILVTPASSPAMNLRRSDGWFFFGVTALTIGSLYFLNTWDYPTYLILVVLAALVRVRLTWQREKPSAEADVDVDVDNKSRLSTRILKNGYTRWVGWTAGLAIVSLALFLPFHLTFISLIGDFPVPEPIASTPILGSLAKMLLFVAWDRTPLLGYLLVFGIFAFPIVSFLAIKLRPYLKEPYSYLDNQPAKPEPDEGAGYGWGMQFAIGGVILFVVSEVAYFALKLNPLISVSLAIVAAPFLAAGAALLGLEILARYRAERRATELRLATGFMAALMVLGGWILRFELFGPLLIVAVACGLLLWFETRPAVEEEAEQALAADSTATPVQGLKLFVADRFVLLLILLGVVIDFGTELIIIRDVFNSRLNTLFKFYYQSWILFALAAAYACWRFLSWAWKLSPYSSHGDSDTAPLELENRPSSGLAGGPVPQAQATLRLSPALGLAGSSNNLAFSSLQMPTAPEIRPASLPARPAFNLAELEDPEAEEAEAYDQARPYRPWWRWLWALALGLFLLAGLIFPFFGPYEKTGHFAQRVGLDGSTWLRDGGMTGPGMPDDYQAIQWLKGQIAANRAFARTILETSGPDWVDYSRVSTFTGLPTLLGWPGHENQWRAGKGPARPGTFDCGLTLAKHNIRPPQSGPSLQKDEPGCRLQLIDFLYSTDNVQLAQTLLREAGVQYVYVGNLEQGIVNRGGTQVKEYPAAGLTKFSQFMKVIYQSGSVTIYSF